MNVLIADDRIDFGEDENRVPTRKRYLRETEGGVLRSVMYVDRRAATKRLRELMGDDVFDYPKDEEVIAKFIEAASTDEDDIILDFFAGSAATGHACWLQNLKDGSNRRFILVQLPEPVQEGSIAERQGFHVISEISRARLRKAGAAVSRTERGTRDLGFQAFQLRQSNLRAWDGLDLTDLEQIEIAFEAAIDPLRADWDPASLLVEVLLGEGFPLDSKIDSVESQGATIRIATSEWVGHRLLTCFDDRISAALAKSLDASHEDVFVCRDSALTDASKLILSERCTLRTI